MANRTRSFAIEYLAIGLNNRFDETVIGTEGDRRRVTIVANQFVESAMDSILFADLPLDDALSFAEHRVRRHAHRQAFVETAFLTLSSCYAVHYTLVALLARIGHVLLYRSPEKALQ